MQGQEKENKQIACFFIQVHSDFLLINWLWIFQCVIKWSAIEAQRHQWEASARFYKFSISLHLQNLEFIQWLLSPAWEELTSKRYDRNTAFTVILVTSFLLQQRKKLFSTEIHSKLLRCKKNNNHLSNFSTHWMLFVLDKRLGKQCKPSAPRNRFQGGGLWFMVFGIPVV